MMSILSRERNAEFGVLEVAKYGEGGEVGSIPKSQDTCRDALNTVCSIILNTNRPKKLVRTNKVGVSPLPAVRNIPFALPGAISKRW
jgi:hypothetical protein